MSSQNTRFNFGLYAITMSNTTRLIGLVLTRLFRSIGVSGNFRISNLEMVRQRQEVVAVGAGSIDQLRLFVPVMHKKGSWSTYSIDVTSLNQNGIQMKEVKHAILESMEDDEPDPDCHRENVDGQKSVSRKSLAIENSDPGLDDGSARDEAVLLFEIHHQNTGPKKPRTLVSLVREFLDVSEGFARKEIRRMKETGLIRAVGKHNLTVRYQLTPMAVELVWEQLKERIVIEDDVHMPVVPDMSPDARAEYIGRLEEDRSTVFDELSSLQVKFSGLFEQARGLWLRIETLKVQLEEMDQEMARCKSD